MRPSARWIPDDRERPQIAFFFIRKSDQCLTCRRSRQPLDDLLSAACPGREIHPGDTSMLNLKKTTEQSRWGENRGLRKVLARARGGQTCRTERSPLLPQILSSQFKRRSAHHGPLWGNTERAGRFISPIPKPGIIARPVRALTARHCPQVLQSGRGACIQSGCSGNAPTPVPLAALARPPGSGFQGMWSATGWGTVHGGRSRKGPT